MPGQSMELRIEDASGKEIVFPVRLVSNTTFGVAESEEGSNDNLKQGLSTAAFGLAGGQG